MEYWKQARLVPPVSSVLVNGEQRTEQVGFSTAPHWLNKTNSNDIVELLLIDSLQRSMNHQRETVKTMGALKKRILDPWRGRRRLRYVGHELGLDVWKDYSLIKVEKPTVDLYRVRLELVHRPRNLLLLHESASKSLFQDCM